MYLRNGQLLCQVKLASILVSPTLFEPFEHCLSHLEGVTVTPSGCARMHLVMRVTELPRQIPQILDTCVELDNLCVYTGTLPMAEPVMGACPGPAAVVTAAALAVLAS